MYNNIEFSIITPAFNVAEYLPQCIESVLNQDYGNYEFIIVNDGSKDNTLDICQQYAKGDGRIRIIDKANGGVSAARKDAVEAATGEYLVFLDADDWLEDGCFAALHQITKKYDPDVIVYGEYSGDVKGIYTPVFPNYAEGLYTRERLRKDIYPRLIQDDRAACFSTSITQKAIRRELFKEHLLSNKEAPIGEDGACFIPCLFHANNLYIIHTPFYYYRYNEKSATKARNVFNWSCPEIINRHIEAHVEMQTSDFQMQMYRKIVHDVFNVVVTRFYQKLTYSEIVEDIEQNLNNPYYKNAINKARFANNKKAQLMSISLRYKFYFLIYILSRLR